MSIFDFKFSVFDLELKYAFWVATLMAAFVLTTWRKDNSNGEFTATLLTLIASLLVGVLVILYFIASKLGALTIGKVSMRNLLNGGKTSSAKSTRNDVHMLELLLLAIFVMLVLIYVQLRKNTKETDSYFAAIDLSLRQFFANLSSAKTEEDKKRHEEVLRQLDKISTHSGTTAQILNQVHNPKSVEDEYYETEQKSKLLARAQRGRENLDKGKS